MFCSYKCAGIYRHKFRTGKNSGHWTGGPLKKRCITCQKTFKVIKSKYNRNKNCSIKCQAKWRSKNFRMENHWNWKGGIRVGTRGYVLVKAPIGHPRPDVLGYISEHRHVMETHLGRFLDKKEVVHHKNHIKHDNRIENLELFSSHSEHMRTHNHRKFHNKTQ